jgi:hypothetical protein
VGQHRAGELGEEPLDEVGPGTTFGGQDELKAAGRLGRQEPPGLFGDVRRVIVEDQFDGRVGGIGGVKQFEESMNSRLRWRSLTRA